jgi:asparagine synthase (glutamine-hydrolysing)
MCGIVSVLAGAGGVEEAPLRSALQAIRHRGPDGEGVWIAPDRSVGLGHVRLSLIAIHAGAQPIVSEDGQTVLAVNGEFYGFEAIRGSLERRGHRFRTRSDSEIALHLYEERGLDFLEDLRGEFALVLWDGHARRLIAARDRFGIKPLCYARTGDCLLLASEAKALFTLGVRPAWDREAMFQVTGMQYPPPDRTLFAGVRTLQPGHYLLASSGAVVTRPYWDLDFPPARRPDPFREEDSRGPASELLARLDEAVRLRLRADVPVCCHLSGGLDSAAVAALAARQAPRPTCFTVSFEERDYDELDQAREIAGHLGAELVVVQATQSDLVERLSDAVYFSEGLAINGHLPAKHLLSRSIHRAGFKAVLSGEGSDEILGGYAHLKRDLFLDPATALGDREATVAELTAGNSMMAGIHLAEGVSLDLGAVRRALGFVPTFLEAKGTLGHRMRGILAPEFLAEFAGLDPFAAFLVHFDRAGQLAGRDRVDQSSYLWTKSSLATYILRTLGDGTEMAHSVEGRLPFLDHHLFTFIRGLPIGLKIRGTTEKFVLRQAIRSLLPESVYSRSKHPFTAPPLYRYSSPVLDEYLHDVLLSESFASVPFFDTAALRRLLDRLPDLPEREQVATDPVLMLALTACLLQERFRLST